MFVNDIVSFLRYLTKFEAMLVASNHVRLFGVLSLACGSVECSLRVFCAILFTELGQRHVWWIAEKARKKRVFTITLLFFRCPLHFH